MDNSSFAIGLGVGTVLGLALGVSITIMLKKPENNVVNDESGVMYNYDDKNRLQSILPMNRRTLRGV